MPSRPFDRALFALWIGFMTAQSFRGMFAADDPRIFRWVLLYAGLGVLFVLVNYRRRYFPFPTPRTTCLLILWATTISYVAYLAQGVYYDITLGPAGRFLSQDWAWAGSAIAVFPTVVGVPAALLLAKDDAPLARALAWVTAALMVVVAFYFQSRISWFAMLAYAPFAFRFLHVRQMLAAAALIAASFTFVMGTRTDEAISFVEELVGTSQALWAPTDSDVGRSLQIRAGIDTITQGPMTFLIGTGVYVHRYAIVPAIERLFDEFMPKQTFAIPGSRDDTGKGLTIFRTTGFTALLIDTGIIGILWFALLAGLCIIRLLMQRTAVAWLLAVPVVVSCGWLLANNILEVVLFYLLLMPGGLAQQLALGASSPQPAPGRAPAFAPPQAVHA
jgi:hypothetical protein